ncbi:MAG: DNA polymerase III, subunit gamma and tau [Bacteroidetes bacterium CG2_30_32_10]|nr:MAG: DNA polymerase III, subunit gamma and tau [Bacteroidetes bacterium CG2_30_32_10]
MDNFIVSARKYRPSTFDTVVGQKTITNTLKNAIKNNHLAQAFLFCGPRGVGKTTCARILAQTINCENLTENIEACNECKSCKSFNDSNSFNVHELDAASNNSVEDIRSLVDQVRIPPQIGKYKIYIIDEVHMLSTAAFNAFLKTLEEPPAYAKFILATTEKHKIIPTILSRCQIFDFSRITVDDIAEHLAYVARNENITAEPEALHVIAQKADGALRDALSIFDQIVSFSGNNITYKAVIDNLNVLDYDYYFDITNHIIAGNIPNILLLLNEIIEKGFEGQHFIAGLANHMRNLLVCKDVSTLKLLEVSQSVKEKYNQQSKACPQDFLLKSLEIVTKCDVQYKTTTNKRLQLELALMMLCSITSNKTEPLQEIKPSIAAPVNSKTNIDETKPLPIEPKPQPKPINTPENKAENTVNIEKPKSDTVKKIITGTKSLSELMGGDLNADEKKKSEVNETQSEYTKTNHTFTEEQLNRAWNIYAESIQQENPNFYSSITKNMPVINDNFQLELIIDNVVQEDEINNKKTDLLSFLRKELNNFQISLILTVKQIISEARPYTTKEKFNSMIEKNAYLLKLKEQLDLDIDY